MIDRETELVTGEIATKKIIQLYYDIIYWRALVKKYIVYTFFFFKY